ncbi:MAG: hypothetical protein CMJ78_06080 [Planctomycetaceae bacterium]|nr:hypothetical protein [Planctomycetaceae bacterium]
MFRRLADLATRCRSDSSQCVKRIADLDPYARDDLDLDESQFGMTNQRGIKRCERNSANKNDRARTFQLRQATTPALRRTALKMDKNRPERNTHFGCKGWMISGTRKS